MLRLRTLLFIGFAVVALIPVIMLAWWVSDSALEKEYSAVEDKHLLVAKNLNHALSRYATDVKEVFLLAERNMLQGERAPSPEMATLFKSLHAFRICRLNPDGQTDVYFNISSISGDSPLTPEQISTARERASSDEVTFLPVMTGGTGKPVITLVHRLPDNSLVIGEIETTYIVKLQKAIAFGKKGHAAIVDQDGNVLAHPKPEWVVSHKNIAKIEPVQRMMAGEQGVSFFYSPAIKADMVAGYSWVPETGWGAMIPQPVSELHEHAAEVVKIAVSISLAGMVLALIVAWWLSGFISRPTGEVARVARRIAAHKANTAVVSTPSPSTQELTDLVSSFNTMVNEVTHKTRELEHLANHDPLTQLPNRTLLQSHISQQITQVEADNSQFALMFLDLDEFKEVNDTLGHSCGDMLLQEVAARLTRVVGDAGIVSRQGGDEFAIVLNPGQADTQEDALSQQIVEAINVPFYIDEEEIFIGTSIGIANYPRDARDMENLLRCADLAMYAAKSDATRQYQSYTAELHKTLSDRKVLEYELRQALLNEEFELYYQARVAPQTGELKGFEALVRWNHPLRKLVWPGDFIAITERTGDIMRLGEWIIRQACIDHVRWREAGLGNIRLSVNLSERQFHVNNLVERIDQLFAEYNIDPQHFEFEVTESLAMQKPAKVAETLNQLRQRGFQLSIDDFGTGYSSLERLKQLPIDKIKIDKSFVQGIGPDPKDSAIVEHILYLAKGLNLGVVAEGVELNEQLEFLKEIECAEVQGFIYSKAVQWHEAADLIRQVQLPTREYGKRLKAPEPVA